MLSALIGGMSCVVAQTNIPGGNVSGTWNIAGSPYLVQGSIMVPNDSTLIIEPGVTVNFQGTYKLYVQGRVIAIGTVADTIIFTAANTANGWCGIRFDNTPASNDTSKLSYCKFQYGKATGTPPDDKGGAFYFNNFSKVIISNCHISYCTANTYGGGIYCGSSNPNISNNTISNNGASDGGGIFCENSSPTISNNTISNNPASNGGGISCYYSSNPTISNNTISNNAASCGIFCDYNSSPTILNNTISNNTANCGGGIFCYHSSNPTISNNIISNNAADYGGGIFCWQSSPTILNNTISNNTANFGGGISCYGGSNPTISNNTISDNTANMYGGGISCESSNPTISNDTISNNTTNIGGGIYCYYSSSIISNNIISNNRADPYGGGIYCENSSPTISNNTISNNTTFYLGGGIFCFYYSTPAITNNTIANNDADIGGALYCLDHSDPILRNTILWGNTAFTSGAQVYLYDEASDPNFYYCDVQGGSAGFELNGNIYTGVYQNNIDSDPLFVLPSGGSGTGYDGVTADWSLQSNSPCINTGDPGGTYPATDIAGNPRVFDGRIDIGAYEYQWPIFTASVSQTEFEVYPNPTNGIIFIQMQDVNNISGNLEIEIYDMPGEIICSKNFNTKQTTHNIDISSSPNGIYFLKIYDKDKLYICRIVKQ